MRRFAGRDQSVVFLWGLLVVVGGLSVVLALPYLQYVVGAGLLSYVAYPVAERLSHRLGRSVGAGLTVVLASLAVVAPFALVALVTLNQARALVASLDQSTVTATVDELLERAGLDLTWTDLLEMGSGAVESASRGMLGNVPELVGGLSSMVIGSVVFLFTFYYLLKDGHRLVAWLRRVVPLDRAESDALLVRTDELLWASVIGTVVVAAVQSGLTALAFVALGFPAVVFWTVVTFLLSLLPLIGASVVWVPATLYLLAVGRTVDAVLLLVYGTLVVSGSDNVVRPFVVHRGAHLNSGLVVVGLFGGLAVFGFLGLFVGPVVVGLAKYVAELLVERRDGSGGPERRPPRRARREAGRENE